MNEWEVQDAARRVYRWAGLSLLLTFALQLLLGFLVGMLSVWMPESLVYPTALCLNTGASAAGAFVLARMTGYSFRPKPYSLQALETWGWTAAVVLIGVGLAGSFLMAQLDSALREAGLILSQPDFSLPEESFAGSAIMTLSLCVLGPLFEELLFRGALLHALAPYGGRFAALVSALLFAMMPGNFMQGVPTFIIGLYLAWITLRAGCILPAILAHMIYNTYATLLSEITMTDSTGLLMLAALLHLPIMAGGLVFTAVQTVRGKFTLPRDSEETRPLRWRRMLRSVPMWLTFLTLASLFVFGAIQSF